MCMFYTSIKSQSLELLWVRLSILPEDGIGTGYSNIMPVL